MENILIVEDHRHMRSLLSELLSEVFPGCRLSEAITLRQARQLLRDKCFSMVVVDMRLPDGHGTEIIWEIKQKQPETVCIVVTAYDEDAYLFEALKAGAQGYLLKEHHRDKLADLFRRILECEPPMSPAIARRILKHFQGMEMRCSSSPGTARQGAESPKTSRKQPGVSSLTQRERQVLGYIAKGLTCAETAAYMGIKHSTTASYVKSIYRKLNISSRAEAALEAERMGLFDE